MFIKDGYGISGKVAGVTNDGELLVASTGRSIISFKSLKKQEAFSVYMTHTIEVTDTLEPVFYFEVDEDIKIVGSKIIYSSDSSSINFEGFVAATWTSGGTDKTPINLNLGSTKSLSVIVKDNSSDDLVIGAITRKIFECRVSSGSPTCSYNLDDALILPNGTTFAVLVKGTVGDVATAVFYYYKGD